MARLATIKTAMDIIILARVQVPPVAVECGQSTFIKEGPCLDEACVWYFP